MNIFKRLGLPAEASAEEIVDFIRTDANCPGECLADIECQQCEAELITAYGQREREAGELAGEKRAREKMCPHCMWRCEHVPSHCCIGGPETDGLLATFENCPLMKGEG